MHHFANLARNLAAGLRLVLFVPVSRLAFRIDLVQLLLLLVLSALIDLGVDWARFGADGEFSWFGLGNEFFGAGLLLVSAALLALAFRESALVLALPVLVLAAFPLVQIVRVAPERAVFVGDTVWDVHACQHAGVPCIGLRSGGISTAELLDAGAVAVFAGPADLLESTGGRLGEALPAQPGS